MSIKGFGSASASMHHLLSAPCPLTTAPLLPVNVLHSTIEVFDFPMNQNLLIVEDDMALNRMLTWCFEDLGYRVTAVASCESAVQKARSQRPDFALLDYRLPDGTGLELLQRLRTLYPDLPIIVMSADSDGELPRLAQAEGAYAFLRKPVQAAQLECTFRHALARISHPSV